MLITASGNLLCASCCKIEGTSSVRHIENAKPCTERVLEYRTFADRNVEGGDEDLASLYCIIGDDGDNVVNQVVDFDR